MHPLAIHQTGNWKLANTLLYSTIFRKKTTVIVVVAYKKNGGEVCGSE
jgi:hypothetical protein